jgi:hypothetical protein
MLIFGLILFLWSVLVAVVWLTSSRLTGATHAMSEETPFICGGNYTRWEIGKNDILRSTGPPGTLSANVQMRIAPEYCCLSQQATDLCGHYSSAAIPAESLF